MKVCPECKTKYTRVQDFCPKDGAHLVEEQYEKGKTRQLYDPNIGTVLDGKYRILTRIGEGSSAVVYAALHLMLNRRTAIKTLRDEFIRDETLTSRFIERAHVASKLSHPNIVSVLDSGTMENGVPYLVMEYLEGLPLSEVSARQSPMAAGKAAHITAQVCRAVAAAHRLNILHLNIKPDNVFLIKGEDGRETVKVVDFANTEPHDGSRTSLTKTGLISGTPEYMTPEQAEGKPATERSDIYSVGIVLYELVVGRPPYRDDSLMGTLGKHLFEPLPDPRSFVPGLDQGLTEILQKALAKNPQERFVSMDDFGAALLQFELHGTYKESKNLSPIPDPPEDTYAPKQVKRKRRARQVLRIRFDEEEGFAKLPEKETSPTPEKTSHKPRKTPDPSDSAVHQDRVGTMHQDSVGTRKTVSPRDFYRLQKVVWSTAALLLGLLAGILLLRFGFFQSAESGESVHAADVDPEKTSADKNSVERKRAIRRRAQPLFPEETEELSENEGAEFVANSNPEGAHVFVNGRFIGTTPIVRRFIMKSDRGGQVEIRLPGFVTRRFDVSFDAPVFVEAELEEHDVSQRFEKRDFNTGKSPEHRSIKQQSEESFSNENTVDLNDLKDPF